MLNSSVQTASRAAITTGRYSGLHPAITALTAIFSTVTGARFGGTVATTSRGSRRVPVSIHITRSGVGGTTGSPSVNPRSNMNSKTSSLSPSSIRRAVSLSPRASASSRSAIPGSTDLEPHPGRDSGYDFQSISIDGDSTPAKRASSANISRQSSRPKPTKRRSSAPRESARIIVGTVSSPYANETLSAESSSIGTVKWCRSTSFALPSASWPIAQTATDSPKFLCAASISGIESPQVGQSSLTKQSSDAPADGNARGAVCKSRSSNAGSDSVDTLAIAILALLSTRDGFGKHQKPMLRGRIKFHRRGDIGSLIDSAGDQHLAIGEQVRSILQPRDTGASRAAKAIRFGLIKIRIAHPDHDESLY